MKHFQMSKIFTKLIVIPMMCLLLLGISSERRGANPEINAPFMDTNFDHWLGVFERPSREIYDKRLQILEKLNLKSGMNVADIGAGTGLFSWLIAGKVEFGTVYSVDVSRVFIENIERIANERKLRNIKAILNTQQSVKLPLASIDLALIIDTYHHFEMPVAMMHSIHRALRSGGSLIIVDFRRETGVSNPWVLEHVRSNREAVINEIEQLGFKLVENLDFLKANYFLRFEKKPL